MLLSIHETLGSAYAMSIQSGAKIYDLILPCLQKGEKVELDFADMVCCDPPFLNYAIGALLRDFSENELRDRIQFLHLNELDAETLENVIKICSQYFTDSKFREAVDSIRERIFQDADDW